MSALIPQATPVITDALASDAGPQTGRFAYDGLEPGDIAIVVAAAEAVRNTLSRTIPEIGRHLLRAKAVLPHGRFEAWAEDELGFSSRTARNYMAASVWLEGKPETLSALPPTVLYALAAPAAPQVVLDDVMARVEAGNPLSASAIRTKLAVAEAERDELKRAQKRNPKITAAELRAKKQSQHQEAVVERAMQFGKQQREETEREAHFLPLVLQVRSIGDAFASAVLDLMSSGNYADRVAFSSVLRRVLRG